MECFSFVIFFVVIIIVGALLQPKKKWKDPTPEDADRVWRFGLFQSVVYVKQDKIYFHDRGTVKNFMLSTIGSVVYSTIPTQQNTIYNKMEVYSGGTIAMTVAVPKGATAENIVDDIQRFINWYHTKESTQLPEPPHTQPVKAPVDLAKESSNSNKILVIMVIGLAALFWVMIYVSDKKNSERSALQNNSEVTIAAPKPTELLEELEISESEYKGRPLVKAKVLVEKKKRSKQELEALTNSIFKFYITGGKQCQLDVWDSKKEFENLKYYYDEIDTEVNEGPRNKRWKRKHWVKLCESYLSSVDSFTGEVITYPFFDSLYREYGGKLSK